MPTADERAFEIACWQAVAECRPLNYDPSIWVGMMESHGAAAAARQLLVSGDIQYGFSHLIEMGRPDLTVEYAVLRPQWRALFTNAHREAAQWRLEQAGVTSPPRDG
jgi:hypothetical protein